MTVKELKEALSLLPDDLPIGLNIFLPIANRNCFSDKITGIIIDDNQRVYINSNDGDAK